MIGDKGNTRHLSGFTLVELIVSLSIISLLTVIFLANYRTVNKRTDLSMTAQLMVTNFRFAQAQSLGLMQTGEQFPAGGWGVTLTSDSQGNSAYYIFPDSDDNQFADSDELLAKSGARKFDLPANIYIDRLTMNGLPQTKAVVTFLPPDPITRIYNGSATSTALEIRLKEKTQNSVKTVRVNFLGLVEVID